MPGVGSEELHAQGPFPLPKIQVLQSPRIPAKNALGSDELRHHHIGPEFLAIPPEKGVGDARHGCQINGKPVLKPWQHPGILNWEAAREQTLAAALPAKPGCRPTPVHSGIAQLRDPPMLIPRCMSPLVEKLRHRIRTEGPLSLADFMESALYDAAHGYYASGRARIGREGDFFTAVSVGPLFGTLLARQFMQMWERLGSPGSWSLVEQGAFNGQLAGDILEALKRLAPECFEATRLLLVEPFPRLREKQEETLAGFAGKVAWYASEEALPRFCGVHYSNELLDAFPVFRLRSHRDGWTELRVGADSDRFTWVETPLSREPFMNLQSLHPRLEGAILELPRGLDRWLGLLADRMEKGWLLTLDYGMSDAELALAHRSGGTLAAYRAHQRQADPLAFPGEQDLTTHVNFTFVVQNALSAGWTLECLLDQARFFTALAPLHFQDLRAAPSPEQQRELRAFQTLTHPQWMGRQFKALCLGRDVPPGGKLWQGVPRATGPAN